MKPQDQADESTALAEATTGELNEAHAQFKADMSAEKKTSETCAVAELVAATALTAIKVHREMTYRLFRCPLRADGLPRSCARHAGHGENRLPLFPGG